MKNLILLAKKARLMAHAPYSKFKVGAAIETKDGRVFTGCNVENASLGATCCAERTAVCKAISEGAKSFARIAIVTDSTNPCPPCGICRQVLLEFAPDIEVIMATTKGKTRKSTLTKLLPNGFRKYR